MKAETIDVEVPSFVSMLVGEISVGSCRDEGKRCEDGTGVGKFGEVTGRNEKRLQQAGHY
jgi:hypothetical protein